MKRTEKRHTGFISETLAAAMLAILHLCLVALLISFADQLSHRVLYPAILFASLMVIIPVLTYSRQSRKKTALDNRFAERMSYYSNEIMMMCDPYGTILRVNEKLLTELTLKESDLYGKPFRTIFGIDSHHHDEILRKMLLQRLSEVFEGRISEIVAPILTGEKNEQYIHLKLYPEQKGSTLQHIFISGRVLSSDPITSRLLSSEESYYEMKNDFRLIHLLAYRLTRNLDGKMTTREMLNLQLALQEAMANAIEHGNLSIDYQRKTELRQSNLNYWELLQKEAWQDDNREKTVSIHYSMMNNRVQYVIQDSGDGFDWHEYVEKDHLHDSTGEATFLKDMHGAGIQIIKNSFDEVRYNDSGNTLTLVKYFNHSPGVA